MSKRSVLNQAGASTICLGWSPYAKAIRSFRSVFEVMKCPALKKKALPCAPGLLGLIVATSKFGFASAAIGGTGSGGVGILHSVSGVARVSGSESVFGPLRPGARNRLSVSTQLAFILDPHQIQRQGEGGTINVNFVDAQRKAALVDAIVDRLVAASIRLGDLGRDAQLPAHVERALPSAFKALRLGWCCRLDLRLPGL